MTPLVGANFPVVLLVILAWPGIPLPTAPGARTPACLSGGPGSGSASRMPTAPAGTILPTIRPQDAPRRTTACHPERFRKERR
jgi:hypothetical protein